MEVGWKSDGRRKKQEKPGFHQYRTYAKLLDVGLHARRTHLTALVRASFMRTLVLCTNRDSLSRGDRTLRLFDRYFYDKLGSVARCRHATQFATVFLDNFVGN